MRNGLRIGLVGILLGIATFAILLWQSAPLTIADEKSSDAATPRYETVEQIKAMPSGKATVEHTETYWSLLKTADGKKFYIGSSLAPQEVWHFSYTLKEGQTYEFPSAFIDFQNRKFYVTAEEIKAMTPCKATVESSGACSTSLRIVGGKSFVLGNPGSKPEVWQFLKTLKEGQTYDFPGVFVDYQKEKSMQVMATHQDRQLRVAVVSPGIKGKLAGELKVELLRGKDVLESKTSNLGRAEPSAIYRFDFNAEKGQLDQLRLRVGYQDQSEEIAVSKILLMRGHETSLVSGQEFHTGSKASLVCNVHGVLSLTESPPLPGARVQGRLIDKAGKTHELFEQKTDANGLVQVDFKVPNLKAGQYKLEIATGSVFGEEKLQREVKLKTDAKVMLVTDKPIYQPGQLMHLRALALRPFDLKPIENRELIFEVEDPKGNKIFKKSYQTSEFGSASIDFQLADEVNQGDYHLRAILGDVRAEKSVGVKRYVLPKFKVEMKADKTFYMPREIVKVELQSDYFFGKPVANAQIEVTANTFDVAFRKFHTWKGTTDAAGHAKFDIPLPDYFVGQPLQKGDAIVKLDVKVLDSAEHSETVTKSYSVSDQPIRVSMIPEGGKIAPGLNNRIFVAAVYPDGSAAPDTQVKLWHDPQPTPGAVQQKEEKKGSGEPLAVLKTNSAGLAEFMINPKAEQLRTSKWDTQQVEFLGGRQALAGPTIVLDLRAEAKDTKGSTASIKAELNCHPLGENVLLRLDRAIYQTGDRVEIDIRSSSGLPTVYVDLVRGGQIMLSRWLELKDGQAKQTLDLPPSVFGSIEVHAYQMLHSGEIIRDSRVIYVQAKNDLKIEVQSSKNEYEPGENGRIRFRVSDSQGKPTQAALGIIVVDEAVYALQDLQPGLEKVYFTLQEELLKPSAQLKFSPSDNLENIVRQPIIPAPRQQIAEVLLTGVKLPPPPQWNVNPVLEREQRAENILAFIGSQTFNYAANLGKAVEFDRQQKTWAFKSTLIDDMLKAGYLQQQQLNGLFGDSKLQLEDLTHLEKGFSAENLAKAITMQRIRTVGNVILHSANTNPAKYKKAENWTFPDSMLKETVETQRLDRNYLQDAWGQPLQWVRRAKKTDHKFASPVFDYYDIVSVGLDGKLGTSDDVGLKEAILATSEGYLGNGWWNDGGRAKSSSHALGRNVLQGIHTRTAGRQLGEGFLNARGMRFANGMPAPAAAPGGFGFGGGGIGGAMPPAPMQLEARNAPMMKKEVAGLDRFRMLADPATKPTAPTEAPVTRVRDFFPETMLWQPALITDEKGIADLAINYADSITTWRLSASANSKGGLLGGTTIPLKVFQDFFVDIDLPVSLTQNDEVAFPVAVYNYLKTPQTVRLELQAEPWFELLDAGGLSRSIELKANEVTSVKYRIRANKIGMQQPLLVKAFGSKKSDAVRRSVEVVPNGQKKETVISDRLNGTVQQTITIPENALTEASKLMVRVYPGAMAQVVEGMDGMLRMPCGCFEQTSSSAYPNIMIVDYIKKNRIASPQMLLQSEQYLNVGYQRLLTFERPGGGFDWWGSGEPLVWLSAYGLQEFSDMAKVYPIDRGIIDRTQAFLVKKMDADGTWSNIGATHGETIASMGDPKLLLTSYVTWSLLESGYPKEKMKKSVDFLRANLNGANDNAYILALAANALASYDPKDDSTLDVVKKLDKLRKELPDWKAITFPARGMSLTYAHGNSVDVETTALAAIAMIRTGQSIGSVNQALTYLVKSKQGNGTWGSTQATILALKALLSGMGGQAPKEPVHFAIKINGKVLERGKVDAENAELMQSFDFKDFKQVGKNDVEIEVKGDTNLLYQIVSRHFEPWPQQQLTPQKPAIELDVTYDRTKLSTNDLLKAKATLKYHGTVPTYMVMVDLGIAPGFNVDPGDFAEMVDKGRVKKFSITARQVILYLGDVSPGDELSFEYTLRPRFPLRARTAPSVAYEYNTPANRVEARPIDLVVEEKK